MFAIDKHILAQSDLHEQLKKIRERFDRKSGADKSRGYLSSLSEELEQLNHQFKEKHELIVAIVRNSSLQFADVPYLRDEVFYQFMDDHIAFRAAIMDSMPIPCTSSPLFSSTFVGPAPEPLHNAPAKLPSISLPKFSGNYLEWVSFQDIYQSLVHNNPALSKIQKFFYLKGSLLDEALNLIKPISVTEVNYDQAWSTLQKRYHNKRLIVDTLTAKLFNLPKSKGTTETLKQIHDTTRECLMSLQNLEVKVEEWDPILIHLLVQKLDVGTRKEWEHSLKASSDIPKVEAMLSFLENTFRALESIDGNHDSNNSDKKKKPIHANHVSGKKVCLYCGQEHTIYKCAKFEGLDYKDKKAALFAKRVCFNCLATSHLCNECPSEKRCNVCQKSHNTLIHPPPSTGHSSGVVQPADTVVSANNAGVFHNVFLCTIRLCINSSNSHRTFRALYDLGSQATLIREDVVQLLNLKKIKTPYTVLGVGSQGGTSVKHSVRLNLCSVDGKQVIPCEAIVMPSISSYVPQGSRLTGDLTKIGINKLADPYYNANDAIDIIMGADIASKIVCPGQLFAHNGLVFQNTCFGWVFSGPISANRPQTVSVYNVTIENLIRSFWEQEEISVQNSMSVEDEHCETYFLNTTQRCSSGKYKVQLPFKSVIKENRLPEIHNNLPNALKRFYGLEARFAKQPKFKEMYINFMREYESLNHMTKVGVYPTVANGSCYFLPHHGVWKEGSSTTKLRVVFDGSSKLRGEVSLNEELYSGPALQNDLAQIISRCRRYKYAFCADIEKMFRQIEVLEEHRSYQQILWRYAQNEPISIYKLNTVTYGTTPAPYLAIRVLNQLARDYEKDFPIASQIILLSTYVDDIISGADDVEEALTIFNDLSKLMQKGNLNLRKWTSNSEEFLAHIPVELREKSSNVELKCNENIVKTLGVQWNTTSDTFSFQIYLGDHETITKRAILSEASRIFDPLGFLTPSTIIAKSIFQKLWLAGVDWDSLIPETIADEWRSFRDSVKHLQGVRVPRWIGIVSNLKFELHCFCDASQRAYAAVVYSCVRYSESEVTVNLLQAKSRVAPVKTVTIPRLELCAASLLVRLARVVSESFNVCNISETFYWTDSSIVLCWIRKLPSTLSVYVGNRVSTIQRGSDISHWRYIPSVKNPADCASRGLMPNNLVNHYLWWHGPAFLKSPRSCWPAQLPILESSLEERKTKIASHNVSALVYPDILTRFSSLTRILRVLSWMSRFIAGCKKQPFCKETFLSASEIRVTFNLLIRLSQKVDFHIDSKDPKLTKIFREKSFLKLSPFMDENGIVRVGGRLHNSDLPYQRKHPVLLTKHCPLSKLIILDAHVATFHGGLTLTMAFVNRKFWIISGNQLAKTLIRSCLTCFKLSAKGAEQIMGNLPAVRLQATRAFKHSGVDYAGPISIKNSKLRTSSCSKGYICLFVCLVSKALHLEVVTDLTSSAFIAAFQRFVSRRGACTDLYSDCGTNFIGASKKLKVMFENHKTSLPEGLLEGLSYLGTTWHFIPPASPNFGGLWEAGVKSVKFHLKRIIGEHILTYEEWNTLLCQIESALNSRPLCPMSTDPNDLEILTPGHFLIGEPTKCIPDEDLLQVNTNRLSRWKTIERLKQHFWQRWHSEYLTRLQSRPKWLSTKPDVTVGDLVLVNDHNNSPGQWSMGRIQNVFPGNDGRVRVVDVMTKNKVFKRPISKICLLPVSDLRLTEELQPAQHETHEEQMEPTELL